MSVTSNLELSQVMTSLRAHGWTRELPDENYVLDKSGNQFDDLFRFVLPGYNLRPLELEGAIGSEQLKKGSGNHPRSTEKPQNFFFSDGAVPHAEDSG